MSEDAGRPRLGHALARSPWTLVAALAVVVGVVAWDMLHATSLAYGRRVVPGILGIVVLAVLSRGDVRSLGFRLRLLPSGRWWLLALAIVALVFGLLLVAAYAVGRATVGDIVLPRLFEPSDAGAWVVYAIVVAPLVEETLYRGVLVPPLVAAIGTRGAVVASGAVFATLHWVYGRPGPDNQIAGFVLGWAFVRSGCLWLPIVLHALGNAVVFLFHLGLTKGWFEIPHVRIE